jgi:predicted nuclease of restriction endonuclease-like (RecB) superfamily
MEQHIVNNFAEAIRVIKNAILKSRYRAAILANREQLSLYYGIGKYISENSRVNFWGTNAIETISSRLQQELPGLRGFSVGNIKKMRIFYEQWCKYFENRSLTTHDLESSESQNIEIRSLVTNELEIDLLSGNRSFSIDDLQQINIDYFGSIGFTHHYELLTKTTSLEERLFYIERCATEFWSVEALKRHIKNNLFNNRGKLPNNFNKTISDADLRQKALMSFKDEYLLDYINIESPDDEPDERFLEGEIVANIKNFIMSLGKDFSFIGNQHRLIIEEQEYFIDLLFFNRQLQCLVAIELKRGEFKPEYLGKMNFYLSALDDLVRLPHENCSIGIILCKSQKQSIVEYAIRDMSKPMGVAMFKTELPEEYKDILPNAETLKELL